MNRVAREEKRYYIMQNQLQVKYKLFLQRNMQQRDLSLAYTPGVAEPCLETKDVNNVYKYTAREFSSCDY
jgi:malic enzyme